LSGNLVSVQQATRDCQQQPQLQRSTHGVISGGTAITLR